MEGSEGIFTNSSSTLKDKQYSSGRFEGKNDSCVMIEVGTPEQNGYAEHCYSHIVETGLSLLSHASMPLTY